MFSKKILVLIIAFLILCGFMGCSSAENIKNNNSAHNIESEQNNINDLMTKYGFAAMITESGDLYTWGKSYETIDKGGYKSYKEYSSDSPSKVLKNVKSVDYDNDGFAVALTINGDLFKWEINKTVPMKIFSKVTKFDVGDSSVAFITEDNNLYFYGYNRYGIAGVNSDEFEFKKPIKVMDNIKDVNLGRGKIAAIGTDSKLYIWGGICGHTHRYTPLFVLDNVKKVICDNYAEIYALTKDNKLYTCKGTIKDNDMIPIVTFIKDSVKDVYSSELTTALITTNNELYMWGHDVRYANPYGELGDGTNEGFHEPKKIMENIKFVSLSMHSSSAITINNELYVWGYNDFSALGLGDKSHIYSPTKLMSDIRWVDIVGPVAQSVDGKYYVWSQNTDGELGKTCDIMDIILAPTEISLVY